MRGVLKEGLETDFRLFLKRIYEDFSLTEFEEAVVGVPPHVRGAGRHNRRNGFYYRNLDTVFGWIQGLKVPRPRKGGFKPWYLGQKYERRQQTLNRLAMECFRRGISTRDVRHVMRAVSDVEISHTSVSRLTAGWNEEVKRWHQRKLADDYVYLMFDGIWVKSRSLGTKRRLILVAYGIADGRREIIAYSFAGSESESNWLRFLTNLVHRGLEGKNVELITTDRCSGLAAAIDICFPGIDHQLCWAHKMRNILNNVRRQDQEKVKRGLSPLFNGNWTEKEALSLLSRWARKWKQTYPVAVRCLEKDTERLLQYLKCPPEHHKAIRTSNHIERQFKEVRRRMRPMELTPNQASTDRVLYSTIMIRNEKLREYPLTFTQNLLH
jgi:transposase-like protein